MPRRNFACVSLIAAIMVAGLAPVSANEHASHHRIRVVKSQKLEPVQTAQTNKEAKSEERATTAQLNTSEINPGDSQVERGPIVSVGPQARAFERIRDIAMAPTG